MISSNKNKEFLWKLLHSNGAFRTIRDDQLPYVKNLFETHIANVTTMVKQHKISPDLSTCNHYFVTNIMGALSTFRNTQAVAQPTQTYTPDASYMDTDTPMNVDDFNNQLKAEQAQFDSYKGTSIGSDNTIGTSIDKLDTIQQNVPPETSDIQRPTSPCTVDIQQLVTKINDMEYNIKQLLFRFDELEAKINITDIPADTDIIASD